MSQDTLTRLAQMQTDNRGLTKDAKISNQKLRERDEEIKKLKLEIQELKLEIQGLKDDNLLLSHKIKVSERKKKNDNKKND